MQSIDRAMKIVNVLIKSETNRFFSITELARKCELPVSSMHRILKAMIKHGMIQQDPERKLYGLGTVWLEYGLKVYDTMDYISIIRPELENLMRSAEASVYLSRPVGTESIIIERIDCVSQTIRVHDRLGLRTPMHIGAANKVMLAFMTRTTQEEMVRELVPEEDRSSFYEGLDRIKTDRYAVSHVDGNDDISTVAAPILNHFMEVVGAVSIRLVSYNLAEEKLNELTEEVVNTGSNISRKMGYQK